MPERIYTSAADGTLEAQNEMPFPTEEEFQELIARHPELLDGEQMRPGDPLRWILINREQGIASVPGESVSWSVDHLLVDQDAVPTLAELKRGSSRELRRTIVGQLLEYAAHAAETWTAEELRSTFEQQTTDRGRNPVNELATLLQTDEEPDADGFWETVSTNLSAKRLRLLFVSDDIPDPLVRVVEFLNQQMPGVKVPAVEIKQFHGVTNRTPVPRVLGRSSAVPGGAGRRTSKLDRKSFLDGFISDRISECRQPPDIHRARVWRFHLFWKAKHNNSSSLPSLEEPGQHCLALPGAR